MAARQFNSITSARQARSNSPRCSFSRLGYRVHVWANRHVYSALSQRRHCPDEDGLHFTRHCRRLPAQRNNAAWTGPEEDVRRLTFLVDGNMACGVRGDYLIVRVAAEEADAVLGEPVTRRSI
jgi:hypothetical protein